MNEDLKPTLSKPQSPQAKALDAKFKPAIAAASNLSAGVSENNLTEQELNEIDNMLNEKLFRLMVRDRQRCSVNTGDMRRADYQFVFQNKKMPALL